MAAVRGPVRRLLGATVHRGACWRAGPHYEFVSYFCLHFTVRFAKLGSEIFTAIGKERMYPDPAITPAWYTGRGMGIERGSGGATRLLLYRNDNETGYARLAPGFPALRITTDYAA